MQYSRYLLAVLMIAVLSCAHESLSTRVATNAQQQTTKTSAIKNVKLPRLILIHGPSLGFTTSVSVYHNVSGYKLVVERWIGDECPKKWIRRVKPSQESAFEDLLTILDPYKLPKEDPCQVPVRDGTTWTVTADISTTRISRSRQMTGDNHCAKFQAACHEIMTLIGLSCKGRGCVLERELRGDWKLCP